MRTLLIILLVTTGGWAQGGEPWNEEVLSSFLEAELPEADLLARTRAVGVDFRVDRAIERRLLEAGASRDLLRALGQMLRPPARRRVTAPSEQSFDLVRPGATQVVRIPSGAPGEPTVAALQGVWFSDWGRTTLSTGRRGRGLRGVTEHSRPRSESRMRLIPIGEGCVRVSWTHGETSGRGKLRLARDGQSLSGYWALDGELEQHPWTLWREGAIPDLRGVWMSHWGHTEVTQEGVLVEGVTRYATGREGSFRGLLDGRRLSIVWWNGLETGTGSLQLSPDGGTLAGSWLRDGDPTEHAWELRRAQVPHGLAGHWVSDWGVTRILVEPDGFRGITRYEGGGRGLFTAELERDGTFRVVWRNRGQEGIGRLALSPEGLELTGYWANGPRQQQHPWRLRKR